MILCLCFDSRDDAERVMIEMGRSGVGGAVSTKNPIEPGNEGVFVVVDADYVSFSVATKCVNIWQFGHLAEVDSSDLRDDGFVVQ